MNAFVLTLLGLIIHVIFLKAFFDTYFSSPVLPDLDSISASNSHAKRLVFIVVDGLRSDKFFEETGDSDGPEAFLDFEPGFLNLSDIPFEYTFSSKNPSRAPFLHKLIKNGQALWSVAYATVPTETRPGHVALISGIPEDLSAVATGWQENPVEVDSLFNRTSFTWAYGHPQVIHPFCAPVNQSLCLDYQASAFDDVVDFSGAIDQAIFDKIPLDLLENTFSTSTDSRLYQELHQPKVMFFLHLVGSDSNGHAKKPFSDLYYHNIRYVDYRISRLVKTINEFYGDEDTVFIFTSDHGMHDVGAHGDGHPQNTQIPVVLWGKHVNVGYTGPIEPDSSPTMNQIDICSLAAVLLGIPIPSNNIGRFPMEYLENTPSFRASAAYSLITQATTIATASAQRRKAQSKILYRQFSQLDDVYSRLSRLEDLFASKKYDKYLAEFPTALSLLDQIIKYYQEYDFIFFFVCMILGYTGFISLLILTWQSSAKSTDTFQVKPPSSFLSSFFNHFSSIFIVICSVMQLFAILQGVPVLFHLYLFVPQLCWGLVFFFYPQWYTLFSSISLNALVSLGLSLLVVAGFYHRYLIGISLSLWSLYFHSNRKLVIFSIFVGSFTLIPPQNDLSANLLFISCAMAIGHGFYLNRMVQFSNQSRIFRVQFFIIFLSIFLVLYDEILRNWIPGISSIRHIAAWGVLLVCLVITRFVHDHTEKLHSFQFAYLALFMLLSVNFDGIFFVLLQLYLYQWLQVQIRSPLPSSSTSLPLFYFIALHLAFFGCGNLASISGFQLSSTYRFITAFEPEIMGGLLVLKILLPVMSVHSFFVYVSDQHFCKPQYPQFKSSNLFLLVLVFADISGLNFFFLAETQGSWLEIGSSISRFAISNSFAFLIIILGLFFRLYFSSSSSFTKSNATQKTK